MSGHRFPAGDKRRLDNENRRKVQPPEGIVERMAPSPGEVVADLGCGPGYTALPLARRVSKLYGVDVQQAMLDALMENVPADLKDRVVPVQGELPRIPLGDGSIDRAVAVNVVHEIEDLSLFESELRRCLRQGGKLSIVDFPKHETSFGPPLSERLSEEEMVAKFPYFRKVKAWQYPEFYQLEMELY
ncbi:MAG: methyltransferase domain-containing protein [Methanomassiliicoccus sp.]|nr:methyltransferase domain-containing protein [Methanomassiliicoccus sp.]